VPLSFRFVINTVAFDTSVSFWTSVMGLPPCGGWDRGPSDRGALVQLSAGGVLEIVGHAPGEPVAAYHHQAVAIQYVDEDEVNARRVAILGHGIDVPEPQRQSWGHYSVSLRDPNGLEVVLWSSGST
jgi:uncharacterized glyoxalase superfamily protein PhnB